MRLRPRRGANDAPGYLTGFGWISLALAALLLCGCGVSRREMALVQELASGERALYGKDKAERTKREKEWSGDSAMQSIAPYRLLQQGAERLNAQLELGMDADALKDVALAWADFNGGNWREAQGHQVRVEWKGEAPYAPGATGIAVAILPCVRHAQLLPTDSAYLDQNRKSDLPEGYGVRAVRIVRKKPLCLHAIRSDLCHAGEFFDKHDYLFYHPNGLLRAVVHLERPCREGMTFAYHRYGWSPDLQLSRLETWSATESEETQEVHADYVRYDW